MVGVLEGVTFILLPKSGSGTCYMVFVIVSYHVSYHG